MSSKFKIQYFHKIPQTTSPYLQLLEAKKKIFGYKYQIIKNDKNNQQHNKSISQTQNSALGHKNSKTMSNQKQKHKSQKKNSRKKRSQTEHADERMHQSLFLNRDIEQSQSKEGKHQATKSLFNVDGLHDQSINNPREFMKNYKNIIQNNDDKAIKSFTQQVEKKDYSKEIASHANQSVNSLDKLQINEIDDLINLIDGCIEQSNDYISYLTEKIQILKGDIEVVKDEQLKILRMKDGIINEKQHEIDRLRKELYSLQYGRPQFEKSFETKKLLEIIDKLTEQNSFLKKKLEESFHLETKPYKQHIQQQKKDIYNEIHNKIDILNISIDKKNPDSIHEQQLLKQSKRSKYKPKFYK